MKVGDTIKILPSCELTGMRLNKLAGVDAKIRIKTENGSRLAQEGCKQGV